jgi:hypothetical protein
MKEKYPDKKLYITVSPDINTKLIEFLKWEDYELRLTGLFNEEYRVSPFMDGVNFIVSLFDYSQMLGQWNTFNDEQYWIKELYDSCISYRDTAAQHE